jgi:hypothetical protein
MPAPAPAIMQEVVWKNDEVMGFAVSLVKRALEKLKVGATQFTTDIVPDSERVVPGRGSAGHGIAGSVATMLQTAHVIEPLGHWQDKIWYPLKLKSERSTAKARYIQAYRLTCREFAEKFLQRNEYARTSST